jgi:transcriptional regulator with XRE-family HTH domain
MIARGGDDEKRRHSRSYRCHRKIDYWHDAHTIAGPTPRRFVTRQSDHDRRSLPLGFFIPAVPFCHLTLLVVRPPLRRHERIKVPEGTLGAAFRARRWSRGLEQWEAALEIGVSVNTYCAWETNRRQPDLRYIPPAIRFLGSDWREPGQSLGERIRHKRTAAGLSIRQLAALLGADATTVKSWEAGLHAPSARSAARIHNWLQGVIPQRTSQLTNGHS